MPKIIPDLRQSIIQTALRLFSEKGYDNIEMRSVSKDLGIAVGTLYNHFENKPSLFLAVIEQIYDEYKDILRSGLSKLIDPIDRIEFLIEANYQFILKHQGLFHSLQGLSKLDISNGLHRHHEALVELISIIGEELSPFSKSSSADNIKRLSGVLISATVTLAQQFPNQNRENLLFLKELTRRFLRIEEYEYESK
jgi:AcrR family transcriptional regulator